MSVLVTDAGFGADDFAAGFVPLEEYAGVGGIDLENTADAAEIFAAIQGAEAIRIPFPAFADGRGFSIARRLRQLGYKGRLRAVGHVLADQYPHARRCGFDEVELSDELADRQAEAVWAAPRESYQDRLTTAL
ncbi:MAG: DUF934 domain-containing protein [Pseudomonadota bacterium]